MVEPEAQLRPATEPKTRGGSVDLYLELLKKALTYSLWPNPPVPLETFNYSRSFLKRSAIRAASNVLRMARLGLVRHGEQHPSRRADGSDWPLYGHTMVGFQRLDNLRECIETALREDIAGDILEAGVWRGGASIFARGVLAAYAVTDRKVFVADSFRGLPPPSHPRDEGDRHYLNEFLAISLDEVRGNFAAYGLLDDQVVFLPGWFNETLPDAPVSKLAVLRLDGDMYGSTIDALIHLYPKLSIGGFCIIDDYALQGCKTAVDDFRHEHRITEAILPIDGCAVFWRRATY